MFSAKIRLITLDLTGTVFRFRSPPFSIYNEVAAKRGLKSDDKAMKAAFYAAWKQQNKENPHFGALGRSDSKQWWIDVVHNTMKSKTRKKLLYF